MGIEEGWYGATIRKKWNDPKVQRAIIQLLLRTSEDCDNEYLTAVEDLVFGKRIEHAPCGTMNLPGDPSCYGCGETDVALRPKEDK